MTSDIDDTLALVKARDAFVTVWCEEHGKDRDDLSLEEILELRRDPRWTAPTLERSE